MLEAYPHLLAVRSIISNRLSRMSIPAADTIVRKILTRDIALKTDTAAIAGTGASNEPIGMTNTPGINTFSWSGTSPAAATAWNNLVSMPNELRIDNALFGNLKWLMSPDIFLNLQKRVDAGTATNNDQPTARRMLADAPETTLLGYPYVVSTLAPSLTLALANWSDFYWCQWGTMFLQADSLTPLGKFQTQIMAAIEVDFQVSHPTSFCLATSIA